jgi:hypothetical protein
MPFTIDSNPLKTEKTTTIAPLATAIATMLMRDNTGTALADRLPRRYLKTSCQIRIPSKFENQGLKPKRKFQTLFMG